MNRRRQAFWYSLFLIVIAVSISVPLYNRIEPRLLGIPFFYWFQFVLVIISAIVTALAWRARV